MGRRHVCQLLGLVVALAVMVTCSATDAEAQAPPKPARVGYLISGLLTTVEARQVFDAFRQGLRDGGYVEGHNVVIESRGAESQMDRLPALARELVSLKVDVLVAPSTAAARAARLATSTIPIVSPAMGDPVNDGLVASLGRPGGNLTGSTFLGPELVPKRLELMKEALPAVSRVAVLWHPGAFSERTVSDMRTGMETAAGRLGLHLQIISARTPKEIDAAFPAMTRERAEALLTFPSPMLFAERRRLVTLAAKHRLPAMFNSNEFVSLGGLLAYGANLLELQRRAGLYAAQILKGAKPGDLPVEQPTNFDLAVNLKTARALDLTIPRPLLLRATLVIE